MSGKETSKKNFWIPMQNFRPIGAAVMNCATLVNTQTDLETILDWLYYYLSS